MRMKMRMRMMNRMNRKRIIAGIAAVAAAVSMAGCGMTDSLKETKTDNGSGAGATTAVTAAQVQSSETEAAATAAAPVAPDPAAAETAAGGNEFLDNLNKQMDAFNENVGSVTVEAVGGAPETPDVTAVSPVEPAEPVEPVPAASADDGLVGKRIGDKDHGFITVPKSWCRFQSDSIDDPAMFQYCDGTENNVITMIKYTDYVAQQAADIVYDRLKADPDATITGSRTCEIEGREAYRIDVEYKDLNKSMYTWFIQAEGAAYYLAVEFTDPDVFELAKTYSIEK